MGFWDWHTKKRYFHTNSVHFFEAVNFHTKKTKNTKQSAFHTDSVNWHTKKTKQSALHTNLVNMASFFYYESYRACCKMKSAQWGFSFKKSINFF
jgi:hypothetical protein